MNNLVDIEETSNFIYIIYNINNENKKIKYQKNSKECLKIVNKELNSKKKLLKTMKSNIKKNTINKAIILNIIMFIVCLLSIYFIFTNTFNSDNITRVIGIFICVFLFITSFITTNSIVSKPNALRDNELLKLEINILKLESIKDSIRESLGE